MVAPHIRRRRKAEAAAAEALVKPAWPAKATAPVEKDPVVPKVREAANKTSSPQFKKIKEAPVANSDE